jgi:chromate transport protein ChrA
MRRKPLIISGLKGVECGAVGLVFSAVYRLWIVGWISNAAQDGSPIDGEPWFVLITVAAFAACKWFGFKPLVAILCGGLLGMIWYGVTR